VFNAHAPNALCIHCYAHCFNLALVDCVRNVQGECKFFVLMELLYYVFTSSAKVHVLYLAKQKELHPSMNYSVYVVYTRWACRYFIVDSICSTFDSVIGTLERVKTKPKWLKPKGFLFKLRGSSFFYCW